VKLLLSFLSPSHDEYLIKETLQLLGRMTQNSAGIQQELQRYSATEAYSALLFAQVHDTQIAELAGLALVNLISELPSCLTTIEAHPRYGTIRHELLAAMARALSSSMLRSEQTSMSLSGSKEFSFWGAACIAEWKDGNAGGDRKHSSFVDNPQFLIKAKAGTNLTILLQDTLEATREQDRVKQRPLFLRLCVTAASPETLATRLTQLDINSSGARPASYNEADGVVYLEPGVQAALDLSKTREVALRCHVKSSAPEDMWVVVPHVGCSHQHSRFVLSVFADQEVSIEGELHPWHKRIICSSWSKLCSAPSGIADAHWRNCPQFQMINVGTNPTTVSAFLSYGERDAARNKRHTMVSDPTGGLPEEKPLLSLYVMKSKVPEKRYVGTLSPFVEEYVAHSMVTNAWCVTARWNLEPGDVYAVLAVMAEGTTHEVPLRLTLYTTPNDASSVVCKPLGPAAEWHLTALEGVTDSNGLTQLELLPQAGEGTGGSMQAALVMETKSADAYCSIATEHENVPHKMLIKYQQQQAVLSVPLTAGSFYTMTTRCINQRQEPLKGQPVRLFLYSTKPMQANPQSGHTVAPMSAAQQALVVCHNTAEQISYGEECEPADTKRQSSSDKDTAVADYDPAVLRVVVQELEQQRDQLYSYARAELKSEPPAVLEHLRKDNQELRAKHANVQKELAQTKAIAAAASAEGSSSAAPGLSRSMSASAADPSATELAQLRAQVEMLSAQKASEEAKLKDTQRQLQRQADMVAAAGGDGAALQQQVLTTQRINDQLRETIAKLSSGSDEQAAAVTTQLTQVQDELGSWQKQAQSLEGELAAAKKRTSLVSQNTKESLTTEVDKLTGELEKQVAANRELYKTLAEQPKSSVCTVS